MLLKVSATDQRKVGWMEMWREGRSDDANDSGLVGTWKPESERHIGEGN